VVDSSINQQGGRENVPVYNVVGEAIVTDEELIEKRRAGGDLEQFAEAIDGGSQDASVSFSTGDLTRDQVAWLRSQYASAQASASNGMLLLKQWRQGDTAEVDRGTQIPSDELVPFEKVGYGRPLTIQIRRVYTGNHPRTLFGRGTGMLVTSAIKSEYSGDARPRAVNFLKENVDTSTVVTGPTALQQGSRLVFYTPALTDSSLTLTLEMAFDSYDPSTLEAVSGAMTKAAGLPLFASATLALGPYAVPVGVLLLAGSVGTKIVGDLARGFLDRSAEFSASIDLNLAQPGEKPLTEGFKLVTEQEVSEAWRDRYRVDPDGVVRDRHTGDDYLGAVPYIVISVDGRENDRYKGFAATAAGAGLMQQYYGVGEQGAQPLEAIISGVSLYSDLKYRNEAQELAKKITAAEKRHDVEGAVKLRQQWEAADKKINESLLKPEPLPEPRN